MTSSELRIGNLIKSGSRVYKIAALSSEGIEAIEFDGALYGGKSALIEPIPITEDWLAQFRFTKRLGFERTWVLGDVYYTFHEHNANHQGIQPRGFAALLRCDYVHELQNISFYVNREELKLK